jgi:hypothetical protein
MTSGHRNNLISKAAFRLRCHDKDQTPAMTPFYTATAPTLFF